MNSDKETPSCFTAEEMRAMAEAWNNLHGERLPLNRRFSFGGTQKNGDLIDSPTQLDKVSLWNELTKRLKPFCGTRGDVCWIEQQPILDIIRRTNRKLYEALTHEALKPQGKRKKYEWLNTLDIEAVMKQYEAIYPQFKFIGCFASDHFTLNPEDFPAETIRTSPVSAIIFNVDASSQSGSHWVAVVFVNEGGRLYLEYFDSTGDPPNKRIKTFLRNPYFHDAIYLQNATQHQKKDSECGVYSMYYILQRLEGKTMDDINKKIITDAQMNDYRADLFRPYKS
jgi:hypothetical protein